MPDLWQESDFQRLRKSLDAGTRRQRKQLRYWCYRKQTVLNGGAAFEGCPPEILDQLLLVEADGLFGGWKNFADTWDIGRPDPPELVRRKFSVHEEWHAVMRRVAQPLPGLEAED